MHVHCGLGRRGALKPQVGFRPPVTGNLSKPFQDDTADIRVVDRAVEGRHEGGQLNDGTRVRLTTNACAPPISPLFVVLLYQPVLVSRE